MEAIGSLSAILQVLASAAAAATTVARFINGVRGARQSQKDLKSKIDLLLKTLNLLQSKLARSKEHQHNGNIGVSGASVSNGSHDYDWRREEEEIRQMAITICTDCKDCAMRLERLGNGQNGNAASLMGRVKGQITLEIRMPEIARIEAKIQANVANMQLLLTCLKLFIDDDQVARGNRIETLLREMRQESDVLRTLRDDIVNKSRLSNRTKANDSASANQNSVRNPIIVPDQNGDEWLKTTNRALRTASSLMEKLSRSGSEASYNNQDIDSLSRAGDIPIMLCHPTGIPPSVPSPSPEPANSSAGDSYLQLELLTNLVDSYIQKAKECYNQCQYDQCEKNIHQAIHYGERRYQYYRAAFEEWFDLQLLLEEVYKMQGNLSEAQSLISYLNQPSLANDVPEYKNITCIRRAQLHHAQAEFSLHEYHTYHNITLPHLEKVAESSYSAVASLVRTNIAGSFPDNHLVQLLNGCAEIWSKVADLGGDSVKAKVLRDRHSSLSKDSDVHLSLFQPVLSRDLQFQDTAMHMPGPQDTSSSSPGDPGTFSETLGSPSETAPTEISTVPTQSLCEAAEIGYKSLYQHKFSTHIINVEEKNSSGLTPLLIAAKRGDLNSIKLLVEDKDFCANVNSLDSYGMNALHYSLRGVDFDSKIIEFLLSQDINVNAASFNDDCTPLHYCVKFNHYEAARLLLKSGKVNLEAKNAKGQTAAILAASQSGSFDISMLKLLSNYGAVFDTSLIPREMWHVIEKLQTKRKRRGSMQSSQSGSSQWSRPSWRRGNLMSLLP